MSVLTKPGGFKTSGVYARIKSKGKDVGLIVCSTPASAAGVFTSNCVRGASVDLTRSHIANGRLSAIVASSGCSNVCTGKQGETNALAMAQQVADELSIPVEDIAVASTGLIGMQMPMEKIQLGIAAALAALGDDPDGDVADSILTTDTCRKESTQQVVIGGKAITIGGIAKGSGMIHPDLGTMFCFITTDAEIEAGALQQSLREASEKSFNVISIDGDQSTSDSVIVLASGAAGNAAIKSDTPEYAAFTTALSEVALDLAGQLVRDGEGATKFLSITVSGARNYTEAKQLARFLSTSYLVKTALFGADPNWGRIMMRVGSAGVNVDQDKISLTIGTTKILENGQPVEYDVKAAGEEMAGNEVSFTIELGLGDAQCTAYTCDLTYDYVKINAEYHT
jgi:glutamate N-acetyltransferase / amino-acid N-acetyltransferase